MSETSVYQVLRGHLATLRLAAAAEALPTVLEQASAEGLGHTAMLERLLAIEVTAHYLLARGAELEFVRARPEGQLIADLLAAADPYPPSASSALRRWAERLEAA